MERNVKASKQLFQCNFTECMQNPAISADPQEHNRGTELRNKHLL